jgi:hypothetical protein
MERKKAIEKLTKEVSVWGYHTIADRIGINYVTLFRIVKGKQKYGGNVMTWDKIFSYYKK